MSTLRPSPRSPLFPSKSSSHAPLTPKAGKQPSGQESRGKWSASGQVEIHSTPVTPKGTERISDLKKGLVDMRLALEKQTEALKLANKQIKEKDQALNDLQSANSTLESELIRLRLQLASAFKPNSKETAEDNEEIWVKEQKIQQLKAELEDIKGKVMAKTDFLCSMVQSTQKIGSLDSGALSAAFNDLYESASLARFELEGLQYLLSHMRQGQEFCLEVLESRRLLQTHCPGVDELRREMRTVGELVAEVKEDLTKVYFENCRIHWHSSEEPRSRELSKV